MCCTLFPADSGSWPWSWPSSTVATLFPDRKIPPASRRPLPSCWGSCPDPVTGLLHYKGANRGPEFCLSKCRATRRRTGDDASPVHQASAVPPPCHTLPQSKERKALRTPLEGSLDIKVSNRLSTTHPAAAVHNCPTGELRPHPRHGTGLHLQQDASSCIFRELSIHSSSVYSTRVPRPQREKVHRIT